MEQEKQILYVVTCGDDEESWSVVGVFSSQEKAQDYIDHDGDPGFRIEEHELDARQPCMEQRLWTVSKRIEGKKVVNDESSYIFYDGDHKAGACVRYIRDIHGGEHLMCQVMATGKREADAAAARMCEEVMQHEADRFPHLRREIVADGDVDGREMVVHESHVLFPLYSFETGEILLDRGEGFRRTFFEGGNFNRYDPSLHIPENVKWRRI